MSFAPGSIVYDSEGDFGEVLREEGGRIIVDGGATEWSYDPSELSQVAPALHREFMVSYEQHSYGGYRTITHRYAASVGGDGVILCASDEAAEREARGFVARINEGRTGSFGVENKDAKLYVRQVSAWAEA